LGTETIELKRNPLPGIPKTQTQRYSLLSGQLLRQQTELSNLFGQRLLTIREAAVILGGLTQATVRTYCRTGRLTSIRVGRRGWIRIPLSSVRKLLTEATQNG